MLKTDTTLCDAIFARYLNRIRPREHAPLFHPTLGGAERGRPAPATSFIQNVWRINNCFQYSALVSLRLNLSFLSGLIAPAAVRAAEAALRPLRRRGTSPQLTATVKGRPGQGAAFPPHAAGPSVPTPARPAMTGAPFAPPAMSLASMPAPRTLDRPHLSCTPPAVACASMPAPGAPAKPHLSAGRPAFPALGAPGGLGGAFRPADREYVRLLERSGLPPAQCNAPGFAAIPAGSVTLKARSAGRGLSSCAPLPSGGLAGRLPALGEPRPFLPIHRLYLAESRLSRPSAAVAASPAAVQAGFGAYPGYVLTPSGAGSSPAAPNALGRERRIFPAGGNQLFCARVRRVPLIFDEAHNGSRAARGAAHSGNGGGNASSLRRPASVGSGMAAFPPMRPQAVRREENGASIAPAFYRPVQQIGRAQAPLGMEPPALAPFIGNQPDKAVQRQAKAGNGRQTGSALEMAPSRTARRGDEGRPSPEPSAQAAQRGRPSVPLRAFTQPRPPARPAAGTYMRPASPMRSADQWYARPGSPLRSAGIFAPSHAPRSSPSAPPLGMTHPALPPRFVPADGTRPGLSSVAEPSATAGRRKGFAAAPMIKRPGPAGEETQEQAGIPSLRQHSALQQTLPPATARRQGEQAGRAMSEAVEQAVGKAVEEIHLSRIADRVYRELENRLRQEKLRRGMWG